MGNLNFQFCLRQQKSKTEMASKYIQKFPIPGQFPDILHDFVREVLRDQPENIYEYGAAYFTALDEGVDFQYEQLGKAIPPPKDRLPSGGNYKEMPEGVQAQPEMD